MIEYRVRKIERYEVTRYSENIERTQGGVETVASDLTARQADDIAGAMYERANSMGMSVQATYASGQVLSSAASCGCDCQSNEDCGYCGRRGTISQDSPCEP